MAKVKEQTKLNLEEGSIEIQYYVCEVEGYGVEVIKEDKAILSHSFGDDDCTAYDWFETVRDLIREYGMITGHIKLDCIYGEPNYKESLEQVKKVIDWYAA